MHIPTDGTHTVNPIALGTTPITPPARGASSKNERPTNLYDDPLALFMDSGIYHFFIFLLSCQSSSVMIFLRYRIGLRIVRSWIFLIMFILLGGYSFLFGGGFTYLLSGGASSDSGNNGLVPFSFLMLGLALYRNAVAKELVEHPTRPLHTMARGDSYLTRLLSHLPVIRGYWFHLTSRKLTRPQWFPLSERTVQSWVEPLLIMFVGAVLAWSGSTSLGTWFLLSCICLRLVEQDYYVRGENAYYDHKDSAIEAKVFRAMSDPKYRAEEAGKSGKIGGIAVVSDELMQMRSRRLNMGA